MCQDNRSKGNDETLKGLLFLLFFMWLFGCFNPPPPVDPAPKSMLVMPRADETIKTVDR